MRISVVLPAKNESEGLGRTLPALKRALPEAEIIVVDDGSTDDIAAPQRLSAPAPVPGSRLWPYEHSH